MKTQRPGDQALPHQGQVYIGPEVIADVLRYQGLRDDAIVQRVADDFRTRIALGIERYGHPLQTNNGRDAARDALDELEDAAHYLKQLILETNSPRIRVAYMTMLSLAFDLSGWMADR